jgi:hypothetical protein
MAFGSYNIDSNVTEGSQPASARLALQSLIFIHIGLCCVSLYCVAIIYPEYHISYQSTGLYGAVALIAAFALVSVIFVVADFSFGYFVGFYVYTMITGYLWLNCFSEFVYNHQLTGLSAAASAIAFLLPALFIRSPLHQVWTLSTKGLDRLLDVILLLAAAIFAAGASYNFRLVSVDNIYDFRNSMTSPVILNYLTGIVSTALLPFAFACFVQQNKYWRAGATLLLLLGFYPVTLSKLALLTPVWLVGMLLLSKIFQLRVAVIVSLLAPMVVGVILFILFRNGLLPYKLTIPYFGLINFRMIAIPALAMDYYNEFFFRHDLTYFCQIGVLKRLVSCAYHEPLALVIYKSFGIGGNFNASLFATEGIASVGPIFAPVTAFACGLVIALANRASAGLNPRIILVSGALFAQTLLNIPFTTVLLSHGAVILFLLWYVMPRTSSGGR